MPINFSNVEISTDKFSTWLTRTNQILTELRTRVVTTDSNTAAGNAAITGDFTSNTVYTNTLAGGTFESPDNLTVSTHMDVNRNLILKNTEAAAGNAEARAQINWHHDDVLKYSQYIFGNPGSDPNFYFYKHDGTNLHPIYHITYEDEVISFYQTPNVSGNTMWHEGNDGVGSGLDADKLHGVSGNTYARLDQAQTFTGNQTINGAVVANGGASSGLMIINGGANTSQQLQYKQNNDVKYTAYVSPSQQYVLQNNVAGEATYVVDSATNILKFYQNPTVAGNAIWHAGNLSAPATLDNTNMQTFSGGIQVIHPSSGAYINLDAFSTDFRAQMQWRQGGVSKYTFFVNDNNSNYYMWNDTVNQATFWVGATDNIVRFSNTPQVGTNNIWHEGNFSPNTKVNSASPTFTGGYFSINPYDARHDDGSYMQTYYTSNGGRKWMVRGRDNAGHLFHVGLDIGDIIAQSVTSSGNIGAYSDRRAKKNIERITDALCKVMKLNGYTFDRTDVDLRQAGVIAQELLEVLPELVSGNEKDGYSVAYGNITALLIEAIKELKQENDDLRGELMSIKDRLTKAGI